MSKIENVPMKATITREASDVIANEEFETEKVLHLAEITECEDYPNLIGKEVTASRTILNSKGEEKSMVEKGDDVVLYMSIINDGRGAKPFFNIGTSGTGASDEEILGALGLSATPSKKEKKSKKKGAEQTI